MHTRGDLQMVNPPPSPLYISMWKCLLHKTVINLNIIPCARLMERFSHKNSSTIVTMDLIKGECNCGKITVSIPKPNWPSACSLCHCLNCRASSGSLSVFTPRSFRLAIAKPNKRNQLRSQPPHPKRFSPNKR